MLLLTTKATVVLLLQNLLHNMEKNWEFVPVDIAKTQSRFHRHKDSTEALSHLS